MSVYMLGILKPDLFFALLGCRESKSVGWRTQEENIWVPLLRRGKSNNFGRVLYASNRLILPWREVSKAPTKNNSGFLIIKIKKNHDRKYLESDHLKQEWNGGK